MALWKISVRNSGCPAYKDRRQRLEKGMFVKTASFASPIGIPREQPVLANLFMSKYGVEIDPRCMSRAYFDCEKIG